MDELLQKLLEAEVLSEDTKTELSEAFTSKLDEAIQLAKTNTENDVKATLSEQWITERDALVEAVDSKVTSFLSEEMAELREDINRFRDLEAEYATKLVEAKAQMSDELKSDLGELVEKLDSFLEIRLNSELIELREDLEVQKQNTFGRKIFEAMQDEYSSNYAKEDDLSGTLSETKTRLKDAESSLSESESKFNKLEREMKLEKVLKPLSGRQYEVMEAILGNVDTSQLDEGYKTFIGRVLKESESPAEEKTLNEKVEAPKAKGKIVETVEVNGNTGVKAPVTEVPTQLSESAKANLRKLAGLN